MRRSSLLLVLAGLVVLGGCGDDAGGGGDGVRVVATTTQLGDFAREVGGELVDVHTVLKSGVDPHDYEPRPSDASAVVEADVVLQSGGEVDEWLSDLVEEAGGEADPVVAAEEIGATGDDPHWWQDPRNAVEAVELVRAQLAEADSGNAAAYERNAAALTERIERLDAAIAECFTAIPEDRRKLVTNHDAFGFFADRYGIEVLGSIVPGRSTAAQPSAGEVRELVGAIRDAGVTTIFPEAALNQRLEAAVARDAGARVGPALYADSLGEPGSEGATYVGALRHDAAAIAEGFGGRCDALPR